jgi:hypothetical protein
VLGGLVRVDCDPSGWGWRGWIGGLGWRMLEAEGLAEDAASWWMV